MKERITVDPRVHFGKPCVAGTRIPVQSVLELARDGIDFAEIIRDYYPDLEPEDIRACVQYAMDERQLKISTWDRCHEVSASRLLSHVDRNVAEAANAYSAS